MSAFVGCRGCQSRLFKGNKLYQIFTPKDVVTQSQFINIFASPLLFCLSQKIFPTIKFPQKSIFGNMGNHEMPGSGSASDAQEVKWLVDVVDVFPNCANLIILHRPLYTDLTEIKDDNLDTLPMSGYTFRSQTTKDTGNDASPAPFFAPSKKKTNKNHFCSIRCCIQNHHLLTDIFVGLNSSDSLSFLV